MLPAVDLFLTPHYPWHHHTQQQRAPNRGKNRFSHMRDMRDVTKYYFLEKESLVIQFFGQTVFFSRQKGKEKKEPKKNTVAGALLFLPPPLQKDLKDGGGGKKCFREGRKKVLFGKRGRERRTLERGRNSNAPPPSASLKTIGKSIVGGWGGESQSIPGESPLKYIEREAAEWQKILSPPLRSDLPISHFLPVHKALTGTKLQGLSFFPLPRSFFSAHYTDHWSSKSFFFFSSYRLLPRRGPRQQQQQQQQPRNRSTGGSSNNTGRCLPPLRPPSREGGGARG